MLGLNAQRSYILVIINYPHCCASNFLSGFVVTSYIETAHLHSLILLSDYDSNACGTIRSDTKFDMQAV